ncbi:MAG: hypothetical protein HC836_23060 [Richelia sp. RM2_1_2]|nr:hypothetical protein [Richelia sp. RM2_1_2]
MSEQEQSVCEGVVTGSTYVSKTDKEIKQLALRLYRGEIFTSMQIKEHDTQIIGSIFMPLMLLDDLSRKQLILNGAYCFYEEVSKAGPRSVNGYLCFFSFMYLDRPDAGRLIDRLRDIEEMLGDD